MNPTVTLFARQFYWELKKLFFRKRTHIGFAAFLGLEVAVLLLLQTPTARKGMERVLGRAGYDPSAYLSGLTLAFLVTAATVLLLGALFLALVGGDIVSKEVEDGTLRMTMCRPVSRTRILTVKILSLGVYTFVLALFISFTSLGMGLAHSGPGGLFVFVPTEGIFALHDFWPGLVLHALSGFAIGASLLTASCLAFFFSCCNMKPATATTLTLAVLFSDMILRSLPFFEAFRQDFLTAKMGVWMHLFEARIPWDRFVEDYAVLAAINTSLLLSAWYVFSRRDFK